MPSIRSPLPLAIRAELFSQLASMEKAGLPPQKSFLLLRLPRPYHLRVSATSAALRRGQPIAAAGLRSGLFNELEAALVEAGTSAGSPARVYEKLADHHQIRAIQAATMKSRLLMPAMTLVAALFIQPLPSLVSGTLSIG